MASPYDSRNPYSAPLSAQPLLHPSPREGLPGFAKAMFIIDLIFCTLRLPMVLLAFVGYATLQQRNDPLLSTVVGEIAAGIGIVLFGIPANILALLRVRMAVWLAALSLIATAGSIAVGIWQGTFKIDEFPVGTPQRMGAVVGLALAIIIRVGLAGAYLGAVVQFANFTNRSAGANRSARLEEGYLE